MCNEVKDCGRLIIAVLSDNKDEQDDIRQTINEYMKRSRVVFVSSYENENLLRLFLELSDLIVIGESDFVAKSPNIQAKTIQYSSFVNVVSNISVLASKIAELFGI